MPADAQVEVRASGAAGASAEGDELAFADGLSGMDLEVREVHVDGEQSETVVDDDAVAFVVEGAGEEDATGVDGGDAGSSFGAIVEATMDAGEGAVKDAAGAEGVRPGRGGQWRAEVSGPEGDVSGVGEGLRFDGLVCGDDFEGGGVGGDELLGDVEGDFGVGGGADGDLLLKVGVGLIVERGADCDGIAAGFDFEIDGGESVPVRAALVVKEFEGVSLPGPGGGDGRRGEDEVEEDGRAALEGFRGPVDGGGWEGGLSGGETWNEGECEGEAPDGLEAESPVVFATKDHGARYRLAVILTVVSLALR